MTKKIASTTVEHGEKSAESRNDCIQTEIILQENTALLRQAIENTRLSAVIFDRQMRYLIVSREWFEDNNLTNDIIGSCHYKFNLRQSHSCQ